MDSTQVMHQLRQLAAIKGLDNQARPYKWLKLSGVSEAAAIASDDYDAAACGHHKDSSTVHCDVERSLWGIPCEESRAKARQELKRLLNAVVVISQGKVWYTQGLNALSSVLLLVAGEQLAFQILSNLVYGHLRDTTGSTLDAVVELLGLLLPILKQADPKLAAFIESSNVKTDFALSWLLAWFAQDVHDIDQAARLFDLFLASHPLMPLYVGAVAMASQRSMLMTEEDDSLYSSLKHLDITKERNADQLAHEAMALFQRIPPELLVRRHRKKLQLSVTARAVLTDDGVWSYPQAQGAVNPLSMLSIAIMITSAPVQMLTAAYSAVQTAWLLMLFMWQCFMRSMTIAHVMYRCVVRLQLHSSSSRPSSWSHLVGEGFQGAALLLWRV
eukprot:jgi/Chrzof1/5503/Cz16g05200.t1